MRQLDVLLGRPIYFPLVGRDWFFGIFMFPSCFQRFPMMVPTCSSSSQCTLQIIFTSFSSSQCVPQDVPNSITLGPKVEHNLWTMGQREALYFYCPMFPKKNCNWILIVAPLKKKKKNFKSPSPPNNLIPWTITIDTNEFHCYFLWQNFTKWWQEKKRLQLAQRIFGGVGNGPKLPYFDKKKLKLPYLDQRFLHVVAITYWGFKNLAIGNLFSFKIWWIWAIFSMKNSLYRLKSYFSGRKLAKFRQKNNTVTYMDKFWRQNNSLALNYSSNEMTKWGLNRIIRGLNRGPTHLPGFNNTCDNLFKISTWETRWQ